MLFNKNIIVLFSLFFAAACGNGDGNGPAPCDCQGKADCSCPETDGGTDGTDGSVPLTCSNGTCDQGETCANCLTDCPCQEGEECQSGKCEVKPYECPSDVPPPGQYEACMPKEAKEAYCKSAEPRVCKHGFVEGQPCSTDSDCQSVPKDAWPPCVCWGLPCELVGEWKCPSGDTWTIDMVERNGYCLVGGQFYYKPGMDHLQDPPEGPFEKKVTLLDNNKFQYQESNGYTFTCSRAEPRE